MKLLKMYGNFLERSRDLSIVVAVLSSFLNHLGLLGYEPTIYSIMLLASLSAGQRGGELYQKYWPRLVSRVRS